MTAVIHAAHNGSAAYLARRLEDGAEAIIVTSPIRGAMVKAHVAERREVARQLAAEEARQQRIRERKAGGR